MPNGFEFTGFSSPAVEREFLPTDSTKPGEGVTLWLNLDLLTIEYMEALEAEFNKQCDEAITQFAGIAPEPEPEPETKSGAKKSKALAVAGTKPEPKRDLPALPKVELFLMEKARYRFFIIAMAGQPGEDNPDTRLLRAWNVYRDGKKVPVSYESFLDMPPHALARMYRFIISEASNPTPQEKKASADT